MIQKKKSLQSWNTELQQELKDSFSLESEEEKQEKVEKEVPNFM